MKIEVRKYRNDGEENFFYAVMKDGKTVDVLSEEQDAITKAHKIESFPAMSEIILTIEI